MTHTKNEDLVELLVTDHREVEEMFGLLEKISGVASDEARTLAERVVIELVRHSVAEEAYLYPTVRARVPDGEALADREIAEHAEAEKVMKKLEKLEPADAEFWPTLQTLMADIRHHVAEEEHELFPKLRQAVPEDLLAELGDKARLAKKVAPTRPHPSAPDSPPWNKILAPGAGLVDRLRDALSGRGKPS
ncbi:MAG TPA: hemerythrin domain-containing protein [Mycobacteriales bacterium]|nr:hemerythrin domain-containing protein [Mycobacteriales bacterium]